MLARVLLVLKGKDVKMVVRLDSMVMNVINYVRRLVEVATVIVFTAFVNVYQGFLVSRVICHVLSSHLGQIAMNSVTVI